MMKNKTEATPTDNASAQFETFAQKVLEKNADSTPTINALMNITNLAMLKYAALIIIGVIIGRLVHDIATGGKMGLTEPASLCLMTIMLAISVYMLVLSFVKPKPDSKLVNISFFVFYLSIIIFTSLVTYGRNILVQSLGAESEFIGVSISIAFCMIICFLPMYSKVWSCILGVAFIIIPAIPGLPFVPGHEVFNVLEQVLIVGGYIIAYILIRAINISKAEMTIHLAEKNEEMIRVSYTDALTGMLNRRALSEYIAWLREKSGVIKTGILFFDIDDFKKYNDTFSHIRGDEVLRNIAHAVVNVCGTDQYLFRYGGEEFVIMLPEIEETQIVECGRTINEGVWKANIERSDIAIGRVTITVGCALHTFTFDTLKNDIISAADNQLYIGKRNGKNCVVYNNNVYRYNKNLQDFTVASNTISIAPADGEKNVALIVDDVELNRDILSDILESSFTTVTASDGFEAIEKIKEYRDSIRVIFLDLVMPKMDGFGVLNYLKEEGLSEKMPIFIISGDTALETKMRCLDFGVDDFIPKPFNAGLLTRRVSNALERYRYRDTLENTVSLQLEELHQSNLALARTNENIIEIVGDLVEARSMETGLHVRRMKAYTRALAKEVMARYPKYGLTSEKIDIMVSVCALHDVGKIMISDAILHKPGRLTPAEFEVMKSHTLLGCEIIDSAKDMWNGEYYTLAYEICRYHHERVDGSGYPDGLKGDEIPISAQIVSVADVYDALVAERVYKKPYSCEDANNMIIRGECGAFSSEILDCFTHCCDTFEVLSKTIVKGRFEMTLGEEK